MTMDYRAQHEIACQALSVAKEYAEQNYEISRDTILFKKVQKNGEVRVGYKDFSSKENFKLIPISDVVKRGIDIDSLPEYTQFSTEYHRLKSMLNQFFSSVSFQSRQAVRDAKTEYLRRFYDDRRQIYDAYLSSPEWAAKRQECYKAHGRTCIDCGESHGTDIHHRHYETLGDEDPENDIVPLCSACHELRHASGEL